MGDEKKGTCRCLEPCVAELKVYGHAKGRKLKTIGYVFVPVSIWGENGWLAQWLTCEATKRLFGGNGSLPFSHTNHPLPSVSSGERASFAAGAVTQRN